MDQLEPAYTAGGTANWYLMENYLAGSARN